MKKAVCLMSGGMDSYVAASVAKEEGFRLFCMTVNYSQKNIMEVDCAKKIAERLCAREHRIIGIDLSWMQSALTSKDINIPGRFCAGIPSTYVPARNTIFISLALGYAETVDASAIYTGINSVDFSGYPDCRPEYAERFQRLIDIATKKTSEGGKIKLAAPLLKLSKAGIIKRGVSLGVDFSITRSCYDSEARPCGRCPSCLLRISGFKEAGISDPLYKNS